MKIMNYIKKNFKYCFITSRNKTILNNNKYSFIKIFNPNIYSPRDILPLLTNLSFDIIHIILSENNLDLISKIKNKIGKYSKTKIICSVEYNLEELLKIFRDQNQIKITLSQFDLIISNDSNLINILKGIKQIIKLPKKINNNIFVYKLLEKLYYQKNFYIENYEAIKYSADKITAIILKYFKIKSVIDIGCAQGTWLSMFKKAGIKNILGIDGNWVETNKLEIHKRYFRCFDLKKPLLLNKKYDLLLSLEVAEHIPEEYSNIFINSLINLSPIIIFAAAIPYQGGINHFNEKWPEYWIEKFKAHNFKCIDLIRDKIWNDKKILWWYKQNILIFIKKEYIKKYKLINKKHLINKPILPIVHPDNYLIKASNVYNK